ncbi:MAG: HPF/RaiA family ribosome-associated protein [Bdellovibrionaceae bacterium]|nr:HPF/RaiA family ribosome-associated protein [Pseudobdellovibrionaceae bacterium]
MRLEIHFNHMTRSEHLETFVRERLDPVIEGVLHRHDCHVMVWLMNVHSRVQRGVPELRCEIEIRYPPKRDFFVTKSSDDIHLAIIDSVDALKIHLDEDGKREIERRRTARSAGGI